jgi:hypothetical protein
MKLLKIYTEQENAVVYWFRHQYHIQKAVCSNPVGDKANASYMRDGGSILGRIY